jgi:hypothetical protein
MRLADRGIQGLELAWWAIWLGSLWFMAILVAPGLFKWLPRPEAGLVAGRFFYMMAMYSLVSSGLLFVLSGWVGKFRLGIRVNSIMILILAISLFELAWLQPHMDTLRAAIVGLQGIDLITMRNEFRNLHVFSTVLYSVKMIGALIWGLSRFSVKSTSV